jgi:D-3-phosphoglycerate dehydrogenase / 2-oxoglutarate reductase
MRILFADKFPDHWRQRLEQEGHHIDYHPDIAETDLDKRIGDAQVLVVRSTRVNAAALTANPSLRLVVRAGAGTNTIDTERARELGIAVCNTPGKNAVAVAELAMGLIIALDRRIPDNVADLRRGIWNKKEYSRSNGLYGASLGVLGLGSIGLELIRRAAAFGMQIVVIDKPGRSEPIEAELTRYGSRRVAGLTELAGQVDFLSIHLPAGRDTKGLIGAQVFEAMKPGAAIINTSRGEVIDEAALLDAMERRGLRAGLDVYCDEPGVSEGPFASRLASHPNTYGTHHIGASTEQAQDAVAESVCEVVSRFALGTTINCVNQVA